MTRKKKNKKFGENGSGESEDEPMEAISGSGKRKPDLENEKIDANHTSKRGKTIQDGRDKDSLSKNQSQTPLINTSAKPSSYLYTRANKGPYGVWVRKINKDDSELSVYKIGRVLYKSYKDFEVKRKNKFQSEILFKNFNEANKLLNDKSLVKHNIECFLPKYRVERKGIVRHIPADIKEDDILEACKSDPGMAVSAVRRLNRRNKFATSQEDKWIPSETVLLTFEGQNLPKNLFIFNVRTNVEAYVQKPRQCYSCFKFGHTSVMCKSPNKLCIMCGHNEHEKECAAPTPCCANCKGPHKSIDSQCPAYQERMKINTIMAFDNISFVEARKLLPKNRLEAIAPPARTKENFPNLPTEVNSELHYSEMVTKNLSKQNSAVQPLTETTNTVADAQSAPVANQLDPIKSSNNIQSTAYVPQISTEMKENKSTTSNTDDRKNNLQRITDTLANRLQGQQHS